MSGLELRGSICPKVSCILKYGAHNGESDLITKVLFIVILNTNHRGKKSLVDYARIVKTRK